MGLSGKWIGYYQYKAIKPEDAKRFNEKKFPFSAEFMPSTDNDLTGRMSDAVGAASIQGSLTGDSLQFVKRYERRDTDAVTYVGRLQPNGSLAGTWELKNRKQDLEGTWFMRRRPWWRFW